MGKHAAHFAVICAMVHSLAATGAWPHHLSRSATNTGGTPVPRPAQQAAAAPRDFTLPNGLRVLIVPVDGVKSVAVQAIHPVGFVDDPKGVPQGAHLIEHLLCRGATASYKVNESMERLMSGGGARGAGIVNAETLADWTHYDFVLPAADLELALTVHAERLTSLRIDPAIIEQEGVPAGRELRSVESSPVAPVFKFAVMAAHQGWRFGIEDLRLVEGLEATKPEALQALYDSRYGTAGALIVIAGAVEIDATETLARRVLGASALRENGQHNHANPPIAPARPALNWADIPATRTMTWDSTVASVVLAFEPPANSAAAAALSLWCEVLLGRVATDAALAKVSRMTFGTNTMWPARRDGLPVFFSISVREGTDPAHAAEVLRERVLALAHEVSGGPKGEGGAGTLGIVRGGIEALAQPPDMVISLMKKQLEAGGVAPMGMNPEHLLLGNAALQIGFRASLIGPDAKDWAMRVSAAAKNLPAVVNETFRAERARAVVLTPKK